jgi:OFA family oxalate/formate antiporter-like MFS transporter
MNQDKPPASAGFTVFGLPPRTGRWGFIILGLIAMLSMGTVYSWSIFRRPLQDLYGFQSRESLLPFTVLLVMYAVFMPVAGSRMHRFGPVRTMAFGGLLVALGYMLSARATSLMPLVFTYGLLGGAGVGIAYGVPMAVAAAWFPDKKGLAIGLTVIGFGLSPLVTAPLAAYLIQRIGVSNAFLALGAGFGLILLAVAFCMRMPPADWWPGKSRGASPPLPKPPPSVGILLRRPLFHVLCACYTIGTFAGLSAIGISGSVAKEMIRLSPETTALLVSIFAVFNGLGRPLFGWLADRFQPYRAATLAFGLLFLASGLMFFAGEGDVLLYTAAFALLWMSLGGWLALAPTATLKLFDPANYAGNYGWVFTSYGVGAFLGTMVAGSFRDLFGSYAYLFPLNAGLAVIGMVVAFFFLRLRADIPADPASPVSPV